MTALDRHAIVIVDDRRLDLEAIDIIAGKRHIDRKQLAIGPGLQTEGLGAQARRTGGAARGGVSRAAGDDRAQPGHIGREVQIVARAVIGQIDIHAGDVDTAQRQYIAGARIHLLRHCRQSHGKCQCGSQGEAGMGQGLGSRLQGANQGFIQNCLCDKARARRSRPLERPLP